MPNYFTFAPPPDNFSGSIAELMMRGPEAQAQAQIRIGQAQAQAAQQSGQAWGGAIQNIGNSIAAIPQQMAQQKAQAQESQIRQSQLDDIAQKRADLKSLDDAYSQPGGRDKILESLPGHLKPQVTKQFMDADEAAGKLQKLQTEAAAAASDYTLNLAHQVKAHDYDPGALVGALSHAKQTFSGNPAMLSQITDMQQQLYANPTADGVRGLIDPIIKADLEKKGPIKGAPGDVFLNPADMNGPPVASVPTKPVAPSKSSIALDAATLGTPNETPTAQTSAAALKAMTPPPAAKGLQTEKVLLDNKPAFANFNAETGKYSDPSSGEDISSRIKPIPAASTIINPAMANNVKETVAGMKDGTLPPILPGRATKEYIELVAEAHRQGFDVAKAATDWTATQKHISTMNGAQQLRLNQSINALPDLLDSVQALSDQWQGGRFPILNKANLAAAKGGAYGKDVASVANKLDAQIADVVADLGSVYMGGNSPTDHALGLASKSLNANWDQKVLTDMVKMAKENVTIRKNSIANTGVAGASQNNPYAPAPPPPAATPPPAALVPTLRFNPVTMKLEPIK